MWLRENKTELLVALAFVVLLFLILNPIDALMLDSLEYMVAAGFAVVMAVFITLVWHERARDEREELHRFVASRAAYLLGAGVLAIAIITQKLSGMATDPWLVAALSVMVLGKLVGLLYSRTRH